MAITAQYPEATVGDTTPCATCGHVKAPEKRLHEIACCGLTSHEIRQGFHLMTMDSMLGHIWRDEGTYAAVASSRDISEVDALAWLERAHAGEVERRPWVEGERVVCDRWAD